jgi:polar amino acid transport system substrate-binding protein
VRRLRPLQRRLACIVLLLAACFGPSAASSATPVAKVTPDAALGRILVEARGRAARSCAGPADHQLRRVICSGTLRVGVRDNYPPFGFAEGDRRSGYEIAIAQRIARGLGVKLSLVTVTPADRIALLAENRVDLIIATMGDTALRGGQARFILPHYYASHTVVVGPRGLPLTDLAGVAGRTVCVTVGDSANAELAQHGARLLLFEDPEHLIEELHAGACTLVAQDDSFFARYFADPAFSALYDAKFAFAPLPWGMAVAREHAGQLAAALTLMSEIFHRDGVFLALAQENHISTAFLQQRHAVWARPDCYDANGFAEASCLLPPRASNMAPTPFAASVSIVQDWLNTRLGLHLTLTIFKIKPAWKLVREGIRNSLILIAGTLLATFGFAILFGQALSARTALLRWPARAVLMLLQSTPPLLSLVIAAALADTLFAFSSILALIVSILALGMINGGNAGQAISEAVASLRAEDAAQPPGQRTLYNRHLFTHALRRSITQINAFLINATKATPVASFIGAPELLNTLTDSSSFSSDQATTYWLLLIFYVVAVLIVVQLCLALRGVLERRISAS